MILIPTQTITVTSSNASTATDADNPDYMFDEFLNTQTENATLLEVEIEFNNCDRVALFNLDAYSVDFELTNDDTSTVVQTKSVDLEMSDGEYQQWIVEPIYIYANATLKISINKAGGTAKCGECAIGLSTNVGTTIYGVDTGFVDYSIKATQEVSGYTYLNTGNWSKVVRLKTYIEYDVIDAVFEDLVAVRGTLCVIEGNNENLSDYESMRVLGFIENWEITIDNPTIAWIDFDIQGVI